MMKLTLFVACVLLAISGQVKQVLGVGMGRQQCGLIYCQMGQACSYATGMPTCMYMGGGMNPGMGGGMYPGMGGGMYPGMGGGMYPGMGGGMNPGMGGGMNPGMGGGMYPGMGMGMGMAAMTEEDNPATAPKADVIADKADVIADKAKEAEAAVEEEEEEEEEEENV